MATLTLTKAQFHTIKGDFVTQRFVVVGTQARALGAQGRLPFAGEAFAAEIPADTTLLLQLDRKVGGNEWSIWTVKPSASRPGCAAVEWQQDAVCIRRPDGTFWVNEIQVLWG
jgi:hypothetical protein